MPKTQTAFRLSKSALEQLAFLQGELGKDRTFLVQEAVLLYYLVHLADKQRKNIQISKGYTQNFLFNKDNGEKNGLGCEKSE